MRLYLVRHAIAEDRNPDLWPDDAKRPLTARGIQRFRKAARGLQAVVGPVDVVLSSPFVRARDTAKLLEREANWPAAQICTELTTDSPAAVLDVLQAVDGVESVALVGHEPYLSRFGSVLLAPSAPSFIQLRKGGAVCIERPDVGVSSTGTLVWALPPKILRSLSA